MSKDRRSDEILILRRFSGYLRLHIPALVYDPAFTLDLQTDLRGLEGVRKVNIWRNQGTLSIHYDWMQVPERALLLRIDQIATPASPMRTKEFIKKSHRLTVNSLANAKGEKL